MLLGRTLGPCAPNANRVVKAAMPSSTYVLLIAQMKQSLGAHMPCHTQAAASDT